MSEAGAVYLLADSQTLFPRGTARSFAEDARSFVSGCDARAAYIGAPNGDEPLFYDIFQAAMEIAGVADRRMIRSEYTAADADYLATAAIVVLAGGDVRRGAEVLASTGMGQAVIERHAAGATIAGVSAGAVLLGQPGWMEDPHGDESAMAHEDVGFLSLVPWIVHAHDDEIDAWTRRPRARGDGVYARGLELPSGAGLIVHGDGTIEPLRRSVLEWTQLGDSTVQSFLLPEHARATPKSAHGLAQAPHG